MACWACCCGVAQQQLHWQFEPAGRKASARGPLTDCCAGSSPRLAIPTTHHTPCAKLTIPSRHAHRSAVGADHRDCSQLSDCHGAGRGGALLVFIFKGPGSGAQGSPAGACCRSRAGQCGIAALWPCPAFQQASPCNRALCTCCCAPPTHLLDPAAHSPALTSIPVCPVLSFIHLCPCCCPLNPSRPCCLSPAAPHPCCHLY